MLHQLDQEQSPISGKSHKRKQKCQFLAMCSIIMLMIFQFRSNPFRALTQAYGTMGSNETDVLQHGILETPAWTEDQLVEIQFNITTINVTESPPKMYACDVQSNIMIQLLAFFQAVLPEYELVDMSSVGQGQRGGSHWWAWNEKTGNKYDVFVNSFHGLCSHVTTKWLLQAFQGKIIMGSGESDSPPATMRDFFLIAGPVAHETAQMMRIYYLQYVWWKVFRLDLELLPPEEMTGLLPRTRNTGKHFLIYAASNCVPFRERAFQSFANLGHVHYGGKCRGKLPDSDNVTKFVNRINVGNWENNVLMYHNFRFCLVMEHSGQAGYVTEKILLAFAGGCIPIYFGTVDIFDLFNKDAFVFVEATNPQPAVDVVAYLETNTTAYEAMLNAPILADGNRTVEKYFSITDEIGGGKLKARIREKLGFSKFNFVK